MCRQYGADIFAEKYWNETGDGAMEIMLQDAATVYYFRYKDRIIVVYLDGCEMAGRDYKNQLTPSATPLTQEAQAVVQQTRPGQTVVSAPPGTTIIIDNKNDNYNNNQPVQETTTVSESNSGADSRSDSTSKADIAIRVAEKIADRWGGRSDDREYRRPRSEGRYERPRYERPRYERRERRDDREYRRPREPRPPRVEPIKTRTPIPGTGPNGPSIGRRP
jgi:hypothetical protein